MRTRIALTTSAQRIYKILFGKTINRAETKCMGSLPPLTLPTASATAAAR